MNSWDELELFEIRDLSEEYYQKMHGGSLSAAKYMEIKTNLQQGRSYISSSRKSGELVKPVLIYYGVLSLSRAALLFMNPKLREASLKAGHGISTNNWQNSLTKECPEYENLSVKFSSGTFMEFIKGGGNTDYFYIERESYKEKDGAYNTGNTDLENGYSITLCDLLSRIPDVEEVYRKVYETESLSFNVRVKASELSIVDNGQFFGYTNVEDITNRGIPGIIEQKGNSLILSSSYRVGKNTNGLPHICMPWTGHMITYPFRSSNEFFNISYIGKLYLASYYIGMLARYFPTSWMNLMSKGRGTKIFPVIQRVLDIVDMKYVEKIVKLLKNHKA